MADLNLKGHIWLGYKTLGTDSYNVTSLVESVVKTCVFLFSTKSYCRKQIEELEATTY